MCLRDNLADCTDCGGLQITEKYNLRSSSELVTDCILGRIQLKMFVILKSDSKSQELHFGQTKVNLFVASDEVKLTKLILGIPYMHSTYTKIHFLQNTIKANLS